MNTARNDAETFPLAPRERSDTMFWLVGSRDRFGDAYFVTTDRWLWRSNRPYGVNDRITRVASMHLTIEDVEDALAQEGA